MAQGRAESWSKGGLRREPTAGYFAGRSILLGRFNNAAVNDWQSVGSDVDPFTNRTLAYPKTDMNANTTKDGVLDYLDAPVFGLLPAPYDYWVFDVSNYARIIGELQTQNITNGTLEVAMIAPDDDRRPWIAPPINHVVKTSQITVVNNQITIDMEVAAPFIRVGIGNATFVGPNQRYYLCLVGIRQGTQ